MLFQYPDPPSTDPGCPSFPERSEGLFAPLSEAIQPGPNALHLDQRAGTFPAHHRSNQAVPSSSSQAAKAEEGESRYYKELTVRCTSVLRRKFHGLFKGRPAALKGRAMSAQANGLG